jgi:hypothetical protein
MSETESKDVPDSIVDPISTETNSPDVPIANVIPETSAVDIAVTESTAVSGESKLPEDVTLEENVSATLDENVSGSKRERSPSPSKENENENENEPKERRSRFSDKSAEATEAASNYASILNAQLLGLLNPSPG